jgi:hypothetical protein
VKTAWLAKMRARLLPLVDGGDREVEPAAGERFPIPYTFQPRLGFIQALIGIASAFLRILLGSFLFAIWGTYSLVAWSVIGNYFWRAAALALLFLVFLLSLAAMLLVVSALARTVSPNVRELPPGHGPTSPPVPL